MRNLILRAAFAAALVAIGGGGNNPVAAEKLRVVTGDKYEPFVGLSLPEGGMTTELVMRGFKDAGFEVELFHEPWNRANQNTAAGDFDAYFFDNFRDEFEKDFLFSVTLNVTYTRAVTPLSSKFDYTGPASAKGLSFCLPRDVALGDLDAMAKNGEIQAVRPATYVECLKLLERGRVDFMTGNIVALAWQGRSVYGDGFTKAFRFSEPIRTGYHYVMFPKVKPESQARVAAFSAAYSKLVAAGWCDEVITRHIGAGILKCVNLPPTKNH